VYFFLPFCIPLWDIRRLLRTKSSQTMFYKPAIKLVKQRRTSGGVIGLIKNEYEGDQVWPWTISFSFFLFLNFFIIYFVLYKTLIHRDVVYTCAYTPSEKVPYYTALDTDDGTSLTTVRYRLGVDFPLVTRRLSAPRLYTTALPSFSLILHNPHSTPRWQEWERCVSLARS